MRVRPCAEFLADFPDDRVEDEKDIVVFPGRNIAEEIAAILKVAGFEVSAPEHQFEMGWDFNVMARGKRIWMLVTSDNPSFLQTQFYGGLFAGRRTKAIYADVMMRLNDGLHADARFKNVQWQFQRDLLSGAPGAAGPVEA